MFYVNCVSTVQFTEYLNNGQIGELSIYDILVKDD